LRDTDERLFGPALLEPPLEERPSETAVVEPALRWATVSRLPEFLLDEELGEDFAALPAARTRSLADELLDDFIRDAVFSPASRCDTESRLPEFFAIRRS